jgi:DNA-binding PadR family transcriptional regulator
MATSKVEVVILGLLAEEPLYGYDLLERFRSRSMGFWVEVGKASVYQALRRLEREGFVGGRAQEGSEGPDRRVYRITRAGRARLVAGLAERAAALEPYETSGGLALGFAHLLSASDARRAVDAREAAVRDLLDAIRTERTRTAGERGAAPTVSLAMLDRQEAFAKAELAWIKTFRTTLGRVRR